MTYKYLAEHAETIRIAPQESVCANCRHFHQHYTPSGGTPYTNRVAGLTEKRVEYFVPLSVGHCSCPRRKERFVGDTCPRFEAREEEKEGNR